MPLIIIKLFITIVVFAVGGLGAYAVTNALSTNNSSTQRDDGSAQRGTSSGQRLAIYYVIRSKYLAKVHGQAPRTACQARTSGEPGVSVSVTVCTVETNQAGNADFTFRITEYLGEGDRAPEVLHWGCIEPSPSRTCHVNINNQPKTICYSTNLDDAETRAACAKDAGNKAPENPPTPTG